MSYDRDWLFKNLGNTQRHEWFEKVKNKDTGKEEDVLHGYKASWTCGCHAFTRGAEDGPTKQWHLYPCKEHRDVYQP